MDTSILQTLTQNENAVIGLLAFLVLSLASVVVFQWFHTMKNTVPKWVWERLVDKIDELLKLQDRTLTIIKERLK